MRANKLFRLRLDGEQDLFFVQKTFAGHVVLSTNNALDYITLKHSLDAEGIYYDWNKFKCEIIISDPELLKFSKSQSKKYA